MKRLLPELATEHRGSEAEGCGEPFGMRRFAGLVGRRQALGAIVGGTAAIAALTAVPIPAISSSPNMPEWLAALIAVRLGSTEFVEGRVVLEMPDRADTGLSVPMTVSVPDSPMTDADHVRSIHVVTTRNPQPLVTDYYFTPASGLARVSQRIRLARTQQVYCFALMSDGTSWMTARHVSVALGACADEIFLPDAKQPVDGGTS